MSRKEQIVCDGCGTELTPAEVRYEVQRVRPMEIASRIPIRIGDADHFCSADCLVLWATEEARSAAGGAASESAP
jgi:hypothetical protein